MVSIVLTKKHSVAILSKERQIEVATRKLWKQLTVSELHKKIQGMYVYPIFLSLENISRILKIRYVQGLKLGISGKVFKGDLILYCMICNLTNWFLYTWNNSY